MPMTTLVVGLAIVATPARADLIDLLDFAHGADANRIEAAAADPGATTDDLIDLAATLNLTPTRRRWLSVIVRARVSRSDREGHGRQQVVLQGELIVVPQLLLRPREAPPLPRAERIRRRRCAELIYRRPAPVVAARWSALRCEVRS